MLALTVQNIDHTIQSINQGEYYDDSQSAFYHPHYYLEKKAGRVYHDISGQRCVSVNFEVRPRRDIWDTADVLDYVSFITRTLKSVSECARVAVNYDTAHNIDGRHKHVTLAFTYVMNDNLDKVKNLLIHNIKNKFLEGTIEYEG